VARGESGFSKKFSSLGPVRPGESLRAASHPVKPLADDAGLEPRIVSSGAVGVPRSLAVHLMEASPMAWRVRFKKSIVAGLVVILPLLVSGMVLVWIARLIEGLTSPVLAWLLKERIPGLGSASAVILVAAVGLVATTVVGGRLLKLGENLIARIPLVKGIYVPVKQLVTAFSPENESGFKKVVLVPHPGGTGFAVGFLTREFEVEGEMGRMDPWASVYVPTNHLYLGAILCYPRSALRFPELTVEEAIRIALTGGAAFPESVRRKASDLPRAVREREEVEQLR
jgi:uncharacterized membrane protein